jgi:hypothetical protein
MTNWKTVFVSLLCVSVTGCSMTNGELITHGQYIFPNSDVRPDPTNANITRDLARNFYIWQTPPLPELRNEVLADAVNNNDGSMLVNIKWATTTTTYPFPVPIYSLHLHMEGTIVKTDIYLKKLN